VRVNGFSGRLGLETQVLDLDLASLVLGLGFDLAGQVLVNNTVPVPELFEFLQIKSKG